MVMQPSNFSLNFSFDLSHFIKLWKAATLSNGHAAFKLGSQSVSFYEFLFIIILTMACHFKLERHTAVRMNLQPLFWTVIFSLCQYQFHLMNSLSNFLSQ